MKTMYDFEVETIAGKTTTLADFRGKVLIIANTASKCGLTPQYEGLQKLYETYRDQGLEILGFPSNQFADQEPGGTEEVDQFCKLNYGVTFPLFAKTDVRGASAHPLFQFLTAEQPFQGFDTEDEGANSLLGFLEKTYPEYLPGNDVKWNFTKFVIDQQGRVVARFEPAVQPEAMEDCIRTLLGKAVK